jgi:hypothetical protein
MNLSDLSLFYFAGSKNYQNKLWQKAPQCWKKIEVLDQLDQQSIITVAESGKNTLAQSLDFQKTRNLKFYQQNTKRFYWQIMNSWKSENHRSDMKRNLTNDKEKLDTCGLDGLTATTILLGAYIHRSHKINYEASLKTHGLCV